MDLDFIKYMEDAGQSFRYPNDERYGVKGAVSQLTAREKYKKDDVVNNKNNKFGFGQIDILRKRRKNESNYSI